MTAALLALAALADPGPYAIQGRFADLAPEGTPWGMPAQGLSMTLSFTSGETASSPASWDLKAGSGSVRVTGAFGLSAGTLRGEVQLSSKAGTSLCGIRFDIVSAMETYRAKDQDGKEIELTRPQPVKEDSPLLMGDLLDGASVPSMKIGATGLTWKPETAKLEVTCLLSGCTFSRALFDDHAHSNLAFDTKGRLLVGSAQQPAIYRANLDAGTLEVLASTPDAGARVCVNPVDGSLAYSVVNGHEFRFANAGGTETGVLNQMDDLKGMNGWPSLVQYDGKGRLYVMFGNTVAQMAGERPSFVLSEANGFAFGDYSKFTVARDGTIFVGSGSNVFRFQDGGKNPTKILQGPDWRPGRLHGTEALAVDELHKQLWVASSTEDGYKARVDVFDWSGRYITCIGRGSSAPAETNERWQSECPYPCSIAVAPNGKVYIANYEQKCAVMEFVPLGG